MRYWAMQELASTVLGYSEEQHEELLNGDQDFDSPLIEEFGCDFDQFSALAEKLLSLTPVVQKALSKEKVHAFVKVEDGHGTIIVDTPFNPVKE